MAQAEKVFDKVTRMGEQAQDRAQRVSDQFQRAAEGGWEGAGRSISEVNRGFKDLAAEMPEYSKRPSTMPSVFGSNSLASSHLSKQCKFSLTTPRELTR